MTNPHANRAGLARLTAGGWVAFERVQASQVHVPMIHAADESSERTLCGRLVTFRYGVHPTDSPSMVNCQICRNRLLRWL